MSVDTAALRSMAEDCEGDAALFSAETVLELVEQLEAQQRYIGFCEQRISQARPLVANGPCLCSSSGSTSSPQVGPQIGRHYTCPRCRWLTAS